MTILEGSHDAHPLPPVTPKGVKESKVIANKQGLLNESELPGKLFQLDKDHTVMGTHLIEQKGSNTNAIAKSWGIDVRRKSYSPLVEPGSPEAIKVQEKMNAIFKKTPTSTVEDDARDIVRVRTKPRPRI